MTQVKTKSKIVYLTPISKEAKSQFYFDMSLLHSCRVKDETEDLYLVRSINKECEFWIPKNGNDDWKVES